MQLTTLGREVVESLSVGVSGISLDCNSLCFGRFGLETLCSKSCKCLKESMLELGTMGAGESLFHHLLRLPINMVSLYNSPAASYLPSPEQPVSCNGE